MFTAAAIAAATAAAAVVGLLTAAGDHCVSSIFRD
jgi:hypothetical protein